MYSEVNKHSRCREAIRENWTSTVLSVRKDFLEPLHADASASVIDVVSPAVVSDSSGSVAAESFLRFGSHPVRGILLTDPEESYTRVGKRRADDSTDRLRVKRSLFQEDTVGGGQVRAMSLRAA